MGKIDRERALGKSYPGHRKVNSEAMGLLQSPPSNWPPTGRPPQMLAYDLPPLQDNVGYSYGGGEDEDYDLGPRIQSGPIAYTRPSPPPELHVSIPSAPNLPSKRSYQPPAVHPPSPPSPASSDSESIYSERSASASTRMHIVDLASPPPPVPALPQHLRRPRDELQPEGPVTTPSRPASARMDSIDLASASPSSPFPALPQYLRPRSELPPEEPPLARGDTIIVANLLKSRAKRLANAPERSLTRTSRIERADSIKEAPSPVSPDEQDERPWRGAQSTRQQPLSTPTRNMTVDADGAFADTLEYYASQPIESPRFSDDAMSVSSSETVKPRPTQR
ncbi:MFS general substrate transporter [Mycena venus]|uniref:MFS general substrate transporter n=1 Tax=Mycena venus TaxID=2733690 RepID=A0A8H6Y8N5_9AGAR|nr:MFS general substrate transporter [Mycena venus]